MFFEKSAFLFVFMTILMFSACSVGSVSPDQTVSRGSGKVTMNAANPSPTWYVDARCFFKESGTAGAFDQVAVKDPSIVYTGGKYHLFYTGVTSGGGWQIGYADSSSISGLSSAAHIFFSSLSEGYFCAPEVFYFEPQKKWYMIYNDGTFGAAYAPTTNIDDPNSWVGPQSLGVPGPTGYDFWIICDDTYAYLFNTPPDSSLTIYSRKTTLANFPAGWSTPSVAVTNAFEGTCVYKNLADGNYYLLVEHYTDNRFYELWTAASLDGPWTQVANEWASRAQSGFQCGSLDR